MSQWPHLKGVKFPRLEGEEKAVSILIGNDVPEAHWVYDERSGRRKQPYAVRTPLGWMLIGRLNRSSAAKEAQVNYIRGSHEMLSSQLRRMYDAEFSESLASSKLTMSGEDRRALAILQNSARLVDGHYQLALPWRYRPPSMKNNRCVALRRLHSLEKRFQKDPSLMDKYYKTVNDYIAKDTLSFRVKEKPLPDTRRGILSLVSSLYDPLGFAAPLIPPAKVLLQELCRLDFGWDETVPNETLVKWRAWVEDLQNLKLVSWPRCFKPKEFGVLHNVQIHHFSDASEVGYGAASYLRLVDDKGRIHCGLVMAKSRVAPF